MGRMLRSLPLSFFVSVAAAQDLRVEEVAPGVHAVLEPERMIPGHGSVRRGKDHLRLILRMVDSILKQVESAAAAGGSLEETQASVDPTHFREAPAGRDSVAQRAFDNFIPATVEQAWKELRKQ